MEEYIVLYNPNSGGGKGFLIAKELERIADALEKLNGGK